MSEPSWDRGPRLSLGERFVRAVVLVAQPTVLEVRVIDNPLAAKARIQAKYLPIGYDSDRFLPGRSITIFLLSPFRNEPDYWYASLNWGKRDSNPWLTNCPRLGDEFQGFVANFTGPSGVIVTRDDGVRAFLPRSELPVPVSGDIATVLDIGDGIAAEIIQVDEDALDIVISVSSLRERRDEQARRNQDREDEGDLPPPLPTAHPPQCLAGRTVLVVDDDANLRAAMVRWLAVHGAQALPARDRSSLRAGLATPSLTHVLVDYMMPDRQALWTLVAEWQKQKSDRHVLVMSATDAGQELMNFSWQQAWKPLAVADLLRWITEGHVPPRPNTNTSNGTILRQDGRIEEESVRHRFRHLLEKLCHLHGLAAGLWVLRLREGKYSLRAAHGLTSDLDQEVHTRLRTTLAANCIETGQEITMRIRANDPLWPLLPGGVSHAIALPVIMDEGCQRCLVFYAGCEISEIVRRDLRTYLDEVGLLVTQITLIRQMREQETLAATGLMTAGLFHELRHAINVLAMEVEEVTESVMEEELEPPVGKLRKSLERVTELLNNNLSLVQKQRLDNLDINATVRLLVDSLARNKSYRHVRLIIRSAPGDPEVGLHPMVLEQPLINLLDNALHHAAKRTRGAWVEVRVELSSQDAATPIHVIVEDNANGMGEGERERLFQPRETSKGEEGVGMGLYVSRNLARSAGGEVECLYSWRWIGSAFRIRLPAPLADS